MVGRQEKVSRGLVRIVTIQSFPTGQSTALAIVVHEMIANHRVDLDLPKKPTSSLDHTEQQNSGRDRDSHIDSVLNA